jgi:putative SOS response-associated peptidase YedK
MCYSAQIVQVVRKLYRQLGIRLDYAEAERLFLRRLDEPTLNISRGFEANFDEPQTDEGRRIKQAIDRHRAHMATKTERDLFSQKTRLVGAQRSLQEKETKKAREDERIATHKIASLSAKLADLHRVEAMAADNRIFPMVHAGVIVRQDGNNLLTPMRYFCRPAGKPAFYDKKFPGLYNARRDNLEKFWGDQFGHHHAIMVVEAFYENVQRDGKNVVLQFTPQPAQTMFIACLWSHWVDANQPDVRGFAAITDEPPADVAAAGHDRCIINLRPEHIEAWLTPEGRSVGELQDILSDRAVSVFQHVIEQAA